MPSKILDRHLPLTSNCDYFILEKACELQERRETISCICWIFTTNLTLCSGLYVLVSSVHKISNFVAVVQSLTLCNPMDCCVPGFPAVHLLLKLAQTYVHWVDDAIQPSHLLSASFPTAFNLSQHQGLFQWVGSLNQVTKVLEIQLFPVNIRG